MIAPTFPEFWDQVCEQQMIFKTRKFEWTTKKLEEELKNYLLGNSDKNSIFYTAAYYELKARRAQS